jgi:hypothetical protein
MGDMQGLCRALPRHPTDRLRHGCWTPVFGNGTPVDDGHGNGEDEWCKAALRDNWGRADLKHGRLADDFKPDPFGPKWSKN